MRVSKGKHGTIWPYYPGKFSTFQKEKKSNIKTWIWIKNKDFFFYSSLLSLTNRPPMVYWTGRGKRGKKLTPAKLGFQESWLPKIGQPIRGFGLPAWNWECIQYGENQLIYSFIQQKNKVCGHDPQEIQAVNFLASLQIKYILVALKIKYEEPWDGQWFERLP